MQIDIATNTFMQSLQNSPLTVFSKSVAIIFEPIIIVLASLAIAAFLYYKKRKKESVLLALTILATGVIIKLAKTIFQRPRPPTMLIPETGFSLPSGHATTAVVFFGLLAYLFTKNKSRKTKITASIIVTLIILITAFTRLYLQVHWLTDVLGGIIIGGIILTASIIIYKKF